MPFDPALDSSLAHAPERCLALTAPRIAVRPMLAGDAAALGAFYDGLSQPSRTARFHCGVRSLPQAWLDQMTRIDPANGCVLLAVAGEGTARTIVGEARYAADSDAQAEFAMAIADRFQGCGLGRRLLRRLVRTAKASRIGTLFGDVQRDNAAMLGLAAAEGFVPRRSGGGDARLVTVERRAPRSPCLTQAPAAGAPRYEFAAQT